MDLSFPLASSLPPAPLPKKGEAEEYLGFQGLLGSALDEALLASLEVQGQGLLEDRLSSLWRRRASLKEQCLLLEPAFLRRYALLQDAQPVLDLRHSRDWNGGTRLYRVPPAALERPGPDSLPWPCLLEFQRNMTQGSEDVPAELPDVFTEKTQPRTAAVCIATARWANHASFFLIPDALGLAGDGLLLHPMRSEAEIWVLLGWLNSPVASFWLQQARRGNEPAPFERDWRRPWSKNQQRLAQMPLPLMYHPEVEAMTRQLHRLAQERDADRPARVLQVAGHYTGYLGPPPLQRLLTDWQERDRQRLWKMVGLQEELDWLFYAQLGWIPFELRGRMAQAHARPPTWRAFELQMAQELELQGPAAPEEFKSWGETREWPRTHQLEALPLELRPLTQARWSALQQWSGVGRLESPPFKRRWAEASSSKRLKQAMENWLDEQLEEWASGISGPLEFESAWRRLERNPLAQQVVEALDFSTGARKSLRQRLKFSFKRNTVPGLKQEVFSESRLHPVSSRSNESQREFKRSDFKRQRYWKLRGPGNVPRERYRSWPAPDGECILWAGLPTSQQIAVLEAKLSGSSAESGSDSATKAEIKALQEVLEHYRAVSPVEQEAVKSSGEEE